MSKVAKRCIDINADLGEGFGIYKVCDDEELIKYITSANIACGFHAGDFNIMEKTVALAKRYNIAIGAHISLPDLHGFGRRKIDFSIQEIKNLSLYQLGALYAIAKNYGLKIQHLKLHGYLYHLASENEEVAIAVADTILAFDRRLFWIGFPNSYQEKAAKNMKLRFAGEGFADRAYDESGKLLPRHLQGSIITSPKKACRQVLKLILNPSIKTICVHSDSPNAIQIAKNIRKTLEKQNIQIQPLLSSH